MEIERIIACDDGKVKKFEQKVTLSLCVSYRELWPEEIKVNYIHTDGLDATSVLSHLIRLLSRGERAIVLFDSLTIAGFNIISLPGIYRLTGVPSIVIYTYKPSLRRIREALRLHFKDMPIREKALSLISKTEKVKTKMGDVYIINWGVNKDSAIEIINSTQQYSRVPEPLRVSHIIASSISDLVFL